jgi:hypothetical protein
MSKLEELQKKMAIKKDEITVLRTALKKELNDNFLEILKEAIFNNYTEIKSITWEQGTPSWCDGGPCSFYSMATYGEGLTINGYAEWDDHEDDDGEEMVNIWYRMDNETDGKYQQMIDEIATILSSFSEDDYLDLFGDSVRVTVTPDGSTTEYASVE